VDLPIDMDVAETGEIVTIGRCGVKEMTAGYLHPKGEGK